MISFSITHFYVVFLPLFLFLSLPPSVSYFSYRLDMSHPNDGKTDPAPTQQLETRDGCEGKKSCNIFS